MLRPPDPAPQTSLQNQVQDLSLNSPKRPRTSEDFLRFCDVVLSYANYPNAFCEDEEVSPSFHDIVTIQEERPERKVESPLNSIGESARGSNRSSTSSSDASIGEVETAEFDETWGMITCWCGKPFAGRPMIECECCLIWLHLSCARVRKSNIPKHFKCARCKPPKGRRKRQSSGNSETEPLNTPTPGATTTPNNNNIHLNITHNSPNANSSIHNNHQNHLKNDGRIHQPLPPGVTGIVHNNHNSCKSSICNNNSKFHNTVDFEHHDMLAMKDEGESPDKSHHNRYNNHHTTNGNISASSISPGEGMNHRNPQRNSPSESYENSYSPGNKNHKPKNVRTPNKSPRRAARSRPRKSQKQQSRQQQKQQKQQQKQLQSHQIKNENNTSNTGMPIRLKFSAGPPPTTLGLPTPSPSPSSSSSSSSSMTVGPPPPLIPGLSSSS